jgi:type IV secretion system protein VirB10
MVGLAIGILSIIVLTGHPSSPARPVATPTTSTALAPNPERLRDYQDRLRVIDERARHEPIGDPPPTAITQPVSDARAATPTSADPLAEDRRRRDYDSLFASNVVMSRRPDGQRLQTDQGARARSVRDGLPSDMPATPPSIDDIADAVVRATTRYAPAAPASAPEPDAIARGATPASDSAASGLKSKPASTSPITSTGPTHRVLEGTLIDTVLTNRLDGSVAAPVNCLVTNAVYSHDGQYVVIPAGSRVLGETKPVQTFGETRLAVAFNRLILPDGRTYPLDQFMGLNEIGDAGLRDVVHQHYRSTFGASAAVGLITGFAQYLGTAAFNRGGDQTVILAGNVGDATAQATAQTMNRYLNRPPTITIREGHRVKIYVTSEVELPAYDTRTSGTPVLLAHSR